MHPRLQGRLRRAVGGDVADRSRRPRVEADRALPGLRPDRGLRRPDLPGRGEDVHVVPPRTMGHVHVHARWEPELERTCVVLGSRSLRLPFVHVLDGRRWFTHLPPSRYGTSSCSVGRNTPSSRSSRVRRFPAQTDDRQASTIASRQLGGMPERSNGSGCKPDGYAYAGSNPAPPTNVGKPLDKPS